MLESIRKTPNFGGKKMQKSNEAIKEKNQYRWRMGS